MRVMGYSVKIKICGVRTPEIAVAASEAGADMVGLVFVEASPRYVTREEAVGVAEAVADRVRVVGVFKDQPLEVIERAVALTPLSCVQLHGESSARLVEALSPTPVVCGICFDLQTIETEIERFEKLAARCENLEALLIDTPDPTRLGGGTGQAFDWAALRSLLDVLKPPLPIVLAGGLNASNVAEAVRTVKPWAVDVSSGVESSRGVKNVEKIRAFCLALRGRVA